MLSGLHFYHRTSRKLVTAFGTIFNNIKLVRYNNEGTVEIERINVPISYSSKEKFYKRITEDPNLANQTQINLPRMAFELSGMTYDTLRKVSNHNDHFYGVPNNLVSRVKMAPYNLDFNLHLFVRNIEEGYQIVEQILPYFTPDYSITVEFLQTGSLKLDVPIVFNGITFDETNSDGDAQSTRVITFTLNFTMKGYILGPARSTTIIDDVRSNVYGMVAETLSLTGGNGQDFRLNELVYQGNTIEEASAVGYVKAWSNASNTISLFDVNGSFAANNKVTGYITGAKYNVSTTSTGHQIVEIATTPNPSSSNVSDDFGYTATINEWIYERS